MALTNHQAALIAALKSEGSPSSALPVRTNCGTAIGYLMPLTVKRAADPCVIERICHWRDLHKGAFLTVVEPDPENTRRYLEEVSLSDPARILFLVVDLQERLIGNIGFCNVDANGAELDNVVRGESVISPGFMRWVCTTALDFAFAALGISSIYLNVIADNRRAIELYHGLGFAECGYRALARQTIVGGYRLVEAEQGSSEATDLVLIRMELQEPVFRQRNGSVVQSVKS